VLRYPIAICLVMRRTGGNFYLHKAREIKILRIFIGQCCGSQLWWLEEKSNLRQSFCYHCQPTLRTRNDYIETNTHQFCIFVSWKACFLPVIAANQSCKF